MDKRSDQLHTVTIVANLRQPLLAVTIVANLRQPLLAVTIVANLRQPLLAVPHETTSSLLSICQLELYPVL